MATATAAAVATAVVVPPQSFLAYERVSTARQGASGLGLETKCNAIACFCGEPRHVSINGRFTEVESGKTPNRPELNRALHLSRITGADRKSVV